MKLSRRQLNQIINESLGLNEAVNFNRVRRRKNQYDKDPTPELEAELRKDLEKLRKAKRTAEANDLIDDIEALLPKKVKKSETQSQPATKSEPESDIQFKPNSDSVEVVPDPGSEKDENKDWVPDPHSNKTWVYQLRDCVWYAKDTTRDKEFKLGHASGKPALRDGKFIGPIVDLNNAYPDIVANCNPIKKKPTPAPSSGGNDPVEILEDIVNSYAAPCDAPTWNAFKKNLLGAIRSIPRDGGSQFAELYNTYQGLLNAPDGSAITPGNTWWRAVVYENFCPGGPDTFKQMSAELIDEIKQLKKLDKNFFNKAIVPLKP